MPTLSKIIGALLAVTGFLACPCHLVFTLPVLLALLAGTEIGAFLAANVTLVVLLAAAYSLVGLGSGWFLLTRTRASAARASCCPAPTPGQPQEACAVADRRLDDVGAARDPQGGGAGAIRVRPCEGR